MKLYLSLFVLAVLSWLNSLLMLFTPAWFNPFVGSLLAVVFPIWGAMLFALFARKDTP